MQFDPPRCPHPSCRAFRDPPTNWFWRIGYYRAACHPEPVPRFRCRHCGHSFSRQTFRHDRGDRKPWTNEELFRLLTSGVGLRQSGRNVGLGIRAVLAKLRKFSQTCAALHENLCPRLPAGGTYLFDEEETFEAERSQRVTMPVLIERETWFVVAATAGPIRRLFKEGCQRRLRQDQLELEHGPRRDHSSKCVREVLQELARRVAGSSLVLLTDEKPSYRTLIREVFGDAAVHHCTPGTEERTFENPLFPINTTLAMTRDNNGRLRHRSWLVSKRHERLIQQMHLFIVYRNYVRRRFNRDPAGNTPAVLLNLVPRALTAIEVLSWRQDWGALSPDPFGPAGAPRPMVAA
jgi:transposase-like protein